MGSAVKYGIQLPIRKERVSSSHACGILLRNFAVPIGRCFNCICEFNQGCSQPVSTGLVFTQLHSSSPIFTHLHPYVLVEAFGCKSSVCAKMQTALNTLRWELFHCRQQTATHGPHDEEWLVDNLRGYAEPTCGKDKNKISCAQVA